MLPSILYLLDTNILLAYIRWQMLGQFIEATYRLYSQPLLPIISIVTEAELKSLAQQSGWGQGRRLTMEKTLIDFESRPIADKALIDAYVELDGYSRKQGRKMGKNDLWIAALARETGATLLTTDQDFDHLHPNFITREYIDPNSSQNAGEGTDSDYGE